ncbi:MAG: bifunctional 4-hydroxy-2-oxoglutarate aldolase/2-dehydro-3-deoxy-phosphogluconate aldolase [Candidatus Omnitrophica bacterium]|nr:bifunctional 4-hydroxy-2-oxoglutarate aldolase/2-dehydro-3-deoxy-phosphogluconate aldolase [Candidatus Omnitrophota bacterium]
MDIDRFKELPIMGILRGVKAGIIQPLAETVISAGLKTIEIAMNSPDAAELIKLLKDTAKERLIIGAGTVLTMHDLHKALDSGATFIVMPTLVAAVCEYCTKNKIPVFPGALTPQEIYNAWNAGATMVKIFPAKLFGPAYIKELKGPLPQIELLACGGVGPENIQSFFSSGASAVAFGSSLFRKDWLSKRDFSSIEKNLKALIAAFRDKSRQEPHLIRKI